MIHQQQLLQQQHSSSSSSASRSFIIAVCAIILVIAVSLSQLVTFDDDFQPQPQQLKTAKNTTVVVFENQPELMMSNSSSSSFVGTRQSELDRTHRIRRRGDVRAAYLTHRWRPLQCMNYFASWDVARKIRRLINWSTPYISSMNRRHSHQQQQQQSQSPCSYWKSGFFTRPFLVNNNNSGILQEEEVKRSVPAYCTDDVVLLRSSSSSSNAFDSGNEEDGDLVDPTCSIGRCFVESFARLLLSPADRAKHYNATTTTTTANKTNKTSFLLMIGDSRVRNLWQRFIMLVRSNVPRGEDEMVRPGVVDNYFHLNASYIVFRNGRDDIRVLPHGIGCDDESARGGAKSSSSATPPLLVVCFVWHFRTVPVHLTKFDVDLRRLLRAVRPDAVVWMPTLHDCVGSACDDGNNNEMQQRRLSLSSSNTTSALSLTMTTKKRHLKSIQHFTRILMQHVLDDDGDDDGGGRKKKNPRSTIRHKLILLTTPGSVWTKDLHIEARNSVLKIEARKLVASSSSPTRSTHRHRVHDNITNAVDDDNEESDDASASARTMMKARRIQRQRAKVAVIDTSRWTSIRQPIRCDKVHSMCNFRPMMGFGNVTHFRAVCHGCSDAPNYCFWMRIRQALET